MSTKVKGIFKGFKYISQIFDEKEEKMQIGLPTDVKHLAHIGIEGQSTITPSWMNEFTNNKDETADTSAEDVNGITAGLQNSLHLNVNNSKKSMRKLTSEDSSSLDSSKERPVDAPKPRRHHRSSDRDSQDSSSSSGRARRIRRHSNNGRESQDSPSKPKHSHRRKSKGSSNDGSSKSRSSSKGHESLSDDQFPFSDFGSAGGHRPVGHVSKENEHVAMAITA